MFLRCLAFPRKDGSQRKYLQIVQTYREKGRVRQKIVANLGRLDELIASGTLEKLSDALSRYVEKKELLCKAEELMATSALSFGPVPIFTSLWKKLGLPEAIESATKRETATYDPAPVIFRMVLGRLLDPASKLSAHRWAETIWWDDGAVVKLQHYYRSLGILARSIKKIEEHLYYRERDLFTPAPDLLFFDTTSTYFTGAGPMTDLACHGFSKDNHPENKQVMVGVVMTREGTPLAHHVFPGNTPDAAAFSEVIEELSKRFGIKRVILVGDRGMFNAKVIARIEELKLEYIAGVKMRQDWDVKEIVLENKAAFETVTGNLKVKLVELGEERYIVCMNEEEAKRDQAVREEIVSELRVKIAKGPKKMIGNTGYRRYLSVDKDAVQIDEKKIASEKKFDGIYVLRTNTDLSAKEAALAYKGLWQVERAFREMKTTFEIRPMYLSREDRIKGHIAVCFLAFCLQVAFLRIVRGEEKLKELSARSMLQELSEVRMVHLKAGEAEYRIRTELSPGASAIFQAAEVPVPRRVNPVH
jgi:transposase